MWIMDIPLKVLMRLRVEGMKSLSEYYPNLNITDDDKQLEKPSFPTVFMQDIGGAEQGQDIEGKSVNAVLSTIQRLMLLTMKSGQMSVKLCRK